MENYHKSYHNLANKITMPGCRCTNKESYFVKGSPTSKWKCFTCTPPSEGSIAPTKILESAPELYHMDVDSDFLKPLHECIEVNSLQPNIVTSHHTFQFYYLIKNLHKLSAPQLPLKRIQAEKWCWKCFRPECDAVRQRDTTKTHVVTATEYIVNKG